MKIFALFCFVFVVFTASSSLAGEADVLEVEVRKNQEGSYDFSVTVFHGDSGWQHYANKWEVVGIKDTVYGTRILHHPHDDEQPFRRSLSKVKIPKSAKRVIIRAHDSVHNYGGKVVAVELP